MLECGLRVQRWVRVSKKHRPINVMVKESPRVVFGAHTADTDTALNAIVYRMYRVKDSQGQLVVVPKPEAGVFASELGSGRRKVARLVRNSMPVCVRTFDEVVADYTGRRQRIMGDAAEHVRKHGLTVRDSHLKTFVKAEKTNFSAKNTHDAVARVINPRSPRYNVSLARYIKHLEKPIFAAINRLFHRRVVAKGLNAEGVGRLVAKQFTTTTTVGIMIDAKRFDQHVSEEALKFEHELYTMIQGQIPELVWLLKLQRHNTGRGVFSDGQVKWTLRGMRMSGGMNTSLGNIFLMCMMMWGFFKLLKQRHGIKARLVNNGDDCVIFCEGRNQKVVRRELGPYFLRFGFEMEVELAAATCPEEVKFCQTHTLSVGPSGSRKVAVRAYPEALAKDCISFLSIRTDIEHRRWRNAVGSCGLSLTRGVPVFQAFYSSLLKGTEGLKPLVSNEQTGAMFLARGMESKSDPITMEARVSFWAAFGVQPHQQVLLEQRYAQQTHEFYPTLDSLQPHDPLGWLDGMQNVL